ncbi:hypothetical protein K439DRAFT_403278 [Ramaria rubella]|nr:hypothetical protein K439DRAFT_403278 [Ramaria rubella]
MQRCPDRRMIATIHVLRYALFFWGPHTRMTSHQQICFDDIEGLRCENSSSGASLFTHFSTDLCRTFSFWLPWSFSPAQSTIFLHRVVYSWASQTTVPGAAPIEVDLRVHPSHLPVVPHERHVDLED